MSKKEIQERIQETKAQLFDLNLLLGNLNQNIQKKIAELNSLNQELKICLPSDSSSNS